MNYKYKEGDRVYYNTGNERGWGVIRGCSAIISKNYPIWIVQFSPDRKIDTIAYPFSAWLFFDNQLKTEEFEISNPEEKKPESEDAPDDTTT